MLFLTGITGNYESEPPFHKKLIGLVPFNLSDRIKANTCPIYMEDITKLFRDDYISINKAYQVGKFC